MQHFVGIPENQRNVFTTGQLWVGWHVYAPIVCKLGAWHISLQTCFPMQVASQSQSELWLAMYISLFIVTMKVNKDYVK